MRPPRSHVCWFSYHLDALPLMQSVRCAMQTFPSDTAFWVFDQDTAPLPVAVGRWLMDRGVEVRRTSFDRRVNLNGSVSITGQIDCYLSTGAEPDDVIWKVDSDTLVLRPAVYLDHYAARPNLEGAGCYCPRANVGWWGIGYSLRQRVLPALRATFARGCQVSRLAEDIYLSRALIGACPPDQTLTLTTTHEGGAYMSYNFKTALPLEEYARRFDIVTFGDRTKLARLTPPQQRRKQAAAMQLMLEGFLK